MKANSDGAVSKHGDKGEGGAVLRGPDGYFRAAVIMSFVVGIRQLKIVVTNSVKHASTYETTTKITINSTLDIECDERIVLSP